MKGTTQQFHISDVLSVVLEVLVSRSHMDGVHGLCRFMTGGELAPHQLVRATTEIQASLVASLPQLQLVLGDSTRLLADLSARLTASGPRASGRAGSRVRILEDWVESVQLKFGLPDYLAVSPIAYEHANPVDEFIAMQDVMDKEG